MDFNNVYDDAKRADAYAKLEFPGTYFLAYRDLPAIISEHVQGKIALDFGCGTGRSTRFLKSLGFDAVGIDIAEDMLVRARAQDPDGEYYLSAGDGLGQVRDSVFDLALSVFTFDNIPTMEEKVTLFRQLGSLLSGDGKIVSVVSSPEIYVNEWASFTTKDFPENRDARSGDKVKIIMTDVEDQRPVEDIIWADDAYQEVYQQAGLELVKTYKPLARESEPYVWVNETRIAPWVVYVLKKSADAY